MRNGSLLHEWLQLVCEFTLLLLLLLSCAKSHNVVSQLTTASSASCKRSRPPSNLVNGQELTMCDIFWISPQSHSSLSVKPHFLWHTLQWPVRLLTDIEYAWKYIAGHVNYVTPCYHEHVLYACCHAKFGTVTQHEMVLTAPQVSY